MKIRFDNCEICGRALGVSDVISVKDPFRVSQESFHLVKCTGCGTWVLNPRPDAEAMQAFYSSDFLFNEVGTENPSILGRVAAAIQEFNLVSEVRWLKRYLRPGDRYLDYSAGNGQIVTAVHGLGGGAIQIFATEFSEHFRKLLAAIGSVKDVKASIDDFGVDATFDLISAFGVLEHTEQPGVVLGKINARLKPGGRLLLSVPNPESLQGKLSGARWYSWLAPRHFFLMPMSTLEQLMAQHGFRVVGHKHFFLRTCPSTFVLSFFPSLDPLTTRKPLQLAAYAALFYLMVIPELIAALFGRTGFMGVVAVKE